MAVDTEAHKRTVRLNGMRTEQVRAQIKISNLVTRLQADALGELEVPMSDGSRDSAKFLINKAMANPPQILAGGGEDGQHVIEVSWRSE